MSIPLSSNFNLVTQLALDDRFVRADVTARDAIASIQRHDGLLVYTVAEQKIWQLRGGITNANWVDLVGSGDADVAVDKDGVEILATITRLDFQGAGVSVADGGAGRAVVTINSNAQDENFPIVFGECNAPMDIPVTGILVADDHMNRESMNQILFVQGDGGPIDITANPQIDRHNYIGAMLTIIGKSDVNTLTLQNGNGLILNGTAVLGLANVIRLMWNGTSWVERRRNF